LCKIAPSVGLAMPVRFSVRPSIRQSLLIMTISVHFLSDGYMDSNDIWYTEVSWRDAGQVRIMVDPIIIEGVIALGLKKLIWQFPFTFSMMVS
jgi:hypothetical protein